MFVVQDAVSAPLLWRQSFMTFSLTLKHLKQRQRMRSRWMLAAAAMAVGMFAPAVVRAADAPAAATESSYSQFRAPSPDSPEMQWWRDSMKTRDQRLQWWRDARFGMFIHWGVYSELAGEWQGQPVSGYAEHIMRKCKIPLETYKNDVAG